MLMAPLATLLQIWRYRKGYVEFSPTTVSSLVLSFFIVFGLALRVQFAPQMSGTGLDAFFNYWFYPLMLLGCTVILMWQKREAKKTLPWQRFRHYAKNPIAAEEEYRMSSTLGLIAGTSMGCISSLSMGWQFFGMRWGFALCAVEILFAILYGRWLNRKLV
jgi:hypothetical protein